MRAEYGTLAGDHAMRPTVLLFDIDGTLISSGGAGRRAMAAAFDHVHARSGARALEFSFAGMTDRAIVRAGLSALLDEPPKDSDIDRILSAYLIRLTAEVERSATYRVLPGVSPILNWLTGIERVAIGLGTGNVRQGAYAKLARGSLDANFAFGGFGCDAEDRTELLRVGAQRGAAALGLAVENCRVVVIGDTPKDIAAAHGIGAECVAVGTGGFHPTSLLELGARTAFATLQEDGVREALLE